MSDKCDELDKKIDHYQLILLSIGDQITTDRIKVLIEDLQAKKAQLHPEQKQLGLSVKRRDWAASVIDTRRSLAQIGEADACR